MQIQFDREKYLTIAKTQGYDAALTQLHLDMDTWDQTAFEGKKGYQPKILEELNEVRAFSVELWNRASSEVKPLS